MNHPITSSCNDLNLYAANKLFEAKKELQGRSLQNQLKTHKELTAYYKEVKTFFERGSQAAKEQAEQYEQKAKAYRNAFREFPAHTDQEISDAFRLADQQTQLAKEAKNNAMFSKERSVSFDLDRAYHQSRADMLHTEVSYLI